MIFRGVGSSGRCNRLLHLCDLMNVSFLKKMMIMLAGIVSMSTIIMHTGRKEAENKQMHAIHMFWRKRGYTLLMSTSTDDENQS